MTERPSKSAVKRRFKDEEAAAAELARLSDRDLVKLPSGDRVKEEIVRCRDLSGGALKRQIKYLAKIMREDAVEAILDYLADRKGSKAKEISLHREVERLRDVIINEAIEDQQACLQAGESWEPTWSGPAIDGFVESYPVDEGDLRRTVYQYVKTRVHHHSREIFRLVKAALVKEQMVRKLD